MVFGQLLAFRVSLRLEAIELFHSNIRRGISAHSDIDNSYFVTSAYITSSIMPTIVYVNFYSMYRR